MINKRNLFFFLIIVLFTSCSFDNKTGIWKGSEDEKRRISDLEKNQKSIINIKKVYSSDTSFFKELELKKSIKISNPVKNFSWEMSGLNHQNYLE